MRAVQRACTAMGAAASQRGGGGAACIALCVLVWLRASCCWQSGADQVHFKPRSLQGCAAHHTDHATLPALCWPPPHRASNAPTAMQASKINMAFVLQKVADPSEAAAPPLPPPPARHGRGGGRGRGRGRGGDPHPADGGGFYGAGDELAAGPREGEGMAAGGGYENGHQDGGYPLPPPPYAFEQPPGGPGGAPGALSGQPPPMQQQHRGPSQQQQRWQQGAGPGPGSMQQQEVGVGVLGEGCVA